MGDSLITAGILAVVALSEGVRRLKPGTLVLERTRRQWRVARTFELGSGMHLLSWCLPLTTPLVLAVDAPTDDLPERRLAVRLLARARRVRGDLAILRAVGLAVLITLLALPLVANGWGPWAFLTAAQTLVLLCVGQAAVAWIALMRAGAPSRRAAGIAVRLLWPFNAQRAAQLVNEQIAAGAPATVAARALLGDEGYLHAMRPAVFDAIAGAGSTDLLALYSRAELTSFLDRPIQSDGEPFCPRCGTIYRAGITQCADCDGVSLRPAIRT